MSKGCSIPGCRSQIRNTTLFSVSKYSSLAQWWTTTSWYDEVMEASDPRDHKICIVHFREDQLDKNQSELRLLSNVVPSINLPGSFTISAVHENFKLPLPQPVVCGDLVLIYCRFCGKKQKCPLKNHLEDLVESEDLLQLCLGRGRFLEGFPNGVCDPCLQTLKITTKFIKNCEQAQDKLQKMFFGTSQQMEDSMVSELEEEEESDYSSFEMPEAIISLKEETHSPEPEEYEDESMELLEMRNEDPLDEYRKTASKPKKTQKRGPKPATEEQGEIRCTVCSRTFNRKVALQAHMESVHEGRTFSCPICGKVMGWRKTLQRHMKSHEQNFQKHKCDHCDKTFSRPSHLRLHMVRHTGQKVRCVMCQNGYRDNYKLGEHLIKAHNMDPETAKTFSQQAQIW